MFCPEVPHKIYPEVSALALSGGFHQVGSRGSVSW